MRRATPEKGFKEDTDCGDIFGSTEYHLIEREYELIVRKDTDISVGIPGSIRKGVQTQDLLDSRPLSALERERAAANRDSEIVVTVRIRDLGTEIRDLRWLVNVHVQFASSVSSPHVSSREAIYCSIASAATKPSSIKTRQFAAENKIKVTWEKG